MIFLSDCIFAAVGVTCSLALAQISPDGAALAGAFVAALISLNDSRKTEKDRFTLACVFLASVVGGLLLPGAIAFNFYPEWAGRQTFHVWALLGIVGGLLSWALVALVFAFRDAILRRKGKISDGALTRIVGSDPADVPPK